MVRYRPVFQKYGVHVAVRVRLGLGQYVKMDYSLDVLCTFSLPFKNGHVQVPWDIDLHKSKIGSNHYSPKNGE